MFKATGQDVNDTLQFCHLQPASTNSLVSRNNMMYMKPRSTFSCGLPSICGLNGSLDAAATAFEHLASISFRMHG